MAKLLPSTAGPARPWAARRADDEYGISAEPNWRKIDWPSQLRQVEIGGRSVNYVDMGGDAPGAADRTPVVLVHGLAGQWQNWIENIPRLAQERRMVAPDLPGFGASEMPAERISVSGYARCVEAVCERLGLGRVALVGNSLGGFIAAEVALQFAERVERLVLASAAGITNSNLHRAPALTVGRIAGVLAATTVARHKAMARRPVTRHAALALVARHPMRLRADLAYEALFRGAAKAAFEDAFRASLEYDFRDRLGEVRCPTLIVWGSHDAVLPVRDAEEYERLIPNSRRVVMDDTGHVPQIERPRAFNELLISFLDEPAPEAGGAREVSAAA
jgi:pimeloyl-ACP methyl ester carboxylesterase